jgi:hypothetical protein
MLPIPKLCAKFAPSFSGGDDYPSGSRLVTETRNALDSLLPFTASEKKDLDRLLDYGEIEVVLLTEDEGLAAWIMYHPGLEWKALNVREFKGR